MLRNYIKSPETILRVNHQTLGQLKFTTSATPSCAKNDLSRQGKIMKKLFGNRESGSKKRWYPSSEQQSFFQASNLGNSSRGTGGGKNATRRMTVLNKLFMEHITDQLASGGASEIILGKNLQVSRVKITSDFSCVNVYWLGSGEPNTDEDLEHELQRCTGLLRHELSQLKLMGEVPRIKFVKDKLNTNLNQVESLLRNIDFGPAESESETQSPLNLSSQIVKDEFFGKRYSIASVPEPETSATEFPLPEMRHDVLGLNHRDITMKILTKMRKSKQAWEDIQNQDTVETPTESTTSKLDRINQKLTEAAENAAKFEKFLVKRHDRKNVPERKRYDRTDTWNANTSNTELDVETLLSVKQKNLYEQEDFIHDDFENNTNNKP